MSRIGKKLITLPNGVTAKIDGQQVMVTGPKGVLDLTLHHQVKAELTGNEIKVIVARPEDKKEKSLWGLSRSLVFNMVDGVVNGFTKQLEINGIGYKAAVQGKKLILNVGFSHPVEYDIAEDIDIKVEKNIISIAGIDKQKVGQVAAEIRSIKKPEPYKGKGIKYTTEVIRRKAGKAVKGADSK